MSKTKVALVYPSPSLASPQKSPCLSVLHVGEALKQARARGRSDSEYEVRYHDARWDSESHLRECLEWCQIAGVSAMTGFQLKGAMDTLNKAKALGKRTVLGGIHATMLPEQCLQEPYVDSVVVGEGEWAMIEAIHGGPKQIVRAMNLRTKDMVSPVSPETIRYFRYSAYTGDVMLLASRGCPYKCQFCLDGDTPVMMADLTWKPIRDIAVGETVVGLDKIGYGHNIVATSVLATSSRSAPTYEIATTRGTVIATADHPWLMHSNHSRWRNTNRLKIGDKIRWLTQRTDNYSENGDYKVGYIAGANVGDGYTGHYKYPGMSEQNHFGLVGDDEMLDTFKVYAKDLGINVIEGKFNGGKIYPNVTRKVRTNAREQVSYIEEITSAENPSSDYKRGFLGGFYDADGSCDRNTVRFCNRDEEVSIRIAEYLSDFGFEAAIEFYGGKHSGLRLLGGSSEKIRLFSVIRPKVVHKSPVFGLGIGNDCAVVVSVSSAGYRDVYDIQTETENFIANGLVSHNCYIVPFFHKQGQLRWAKVDLEQWKQDILTLKRRTNFKQMAHGDDWIGPAERLFEILEFLKAHDIKYWPSIRAHQINDEVAKELKRLGVEHISVGIETASPRILKLVDKGNDLPDLIQCVESLAKYELWPLLYYITGYPTETQAEINQTLDFMDWAHKQLKGKVTQNAYAYVPLPGNALYDLVNKSTLPQTMAEWSNFSLNQTYNKQASTLYWVGGLTFHRGKGDKTDRNFPGLMRLLIAPLEILATLRWKLRWFAFYAFEKWAIEWLLKWATTRYEKRVGTRVGKMRVSEVEAMDFGVVEGQPDIGARGEFVTGEIGNG